MTKKVKLLPNTHTKHAKAAPSFSPVFSLFRSYANAIMRHIPISPSQSPFSLLVSSFKTPPKNDKRDQNSTNSCCYCCFSFCCCCCFCWDMQIAKSGYGVNAPCRAPSALSSFNSLPLALDIFGPQPPRRVQSAWEQFQLQLSISPIPVPVPVPAPVPIPIHIHIDVHVAIRQRFNRDCAFAWKSLKLNASDGNLYASPARRQRGRWGGGGKAGSARSRSQSLPPLKVVPKLICVGFLEDGCGGRGGSGGTRANFLPRDFPVSSFCRFLFSACVGGGGIRVFSQSGRQAGQASSVDS